MKLHMRNDMRRITAGLAPVILLALGACSITTGGATSENEAKPVPMSTAKAETPLPHIGLYAYTHAHASNPNPPDRWGGVVTVSANQTHGATQWVLPGPRELDPVVFGTPDHPVGWEQAPFPLIGIPPELRRSAGNQYTIVDHATPFSNWREIGVGDVHMSITDQTAIDGAKTKDKVSFTAEFDSPNHLHHYKVVTLRPLPHGFGYPTFGGVVTDHLMHGGTGIGTRLMPTEMIYASFWAAGDIYVDGRLTNHNQIIHMMIGEGVRGHGWKLGHDKDIRGEGVVMHLMVPPYKVGLNGPVKAPVMSGYIPFPEIKAHMMKTMAKVKSMPEEKQKMMMPKLMEARDLMEKTKKWAQGEMAAGRMFGQPFFHVMFGNVTYKVSHR